jgi:hypothetical protein
MTRQVLFFLGLMVTVGVASVVALFFSWGQMDRIFFLFLGVFLVVVLAEIWADTSTRPTKDEKTFSLWEKMLFTEPKTWQKWVFVCWMIAGPLYLLLEWWAFDGSARETDVNKRLAQTQKLASDLWTSCAVIFVVFWGLKKA